MNYWKIRYIPQMIINSITICLKKTYVGKGTCIYGRILIKGNGGITIGEQCLINSSIHANPVGGDHHVILRADTAGEIVIGNRCGLSNCTLVAQEKITIEDDVLIGANAKIYDTDFHLVLFEDRKNKSQTPKTKPVLIKKGAFVGAHTIILKGVTIGEKSVIGAGSVVTHDVPDNQIWAGNPARFVRQL